MVLEDRVEQMSRVCAEKAALEETPRKNDEKILSPLRWDKAALEESLREKDEKNSSTLRWEKAALDHEKTLREKDERIMALLRREKAALEKTLRDRDENIMALRGENEEHRKALDDLPQWVKHLMRLKKAKEEKKRKAEPEDDLYTIIKVARDEDFCEQIGNNIYFDLMDYDKVHHFRVQKQLPFTAFKEEVAKEFGIPVQFQRYWLWAKRENHTYRPYCPLTAHEEMQTVGKLRVFSKTARNVELKLFLEVELGLDLSLLPPPNKSKKDILIFLKLYDPEKEELRYVGRMFVKEAGKPQDILVELNELAGFPENEETDLFEEIKFEPNIMCEPIDKRISFRKSQLENGDIICFQKAISGSETNYRYPDVPSFLGYVRNHTTVHFRLLEKTTEKGFCVVLSKHHTYDYVVETVALNIGLEDPCKIRLTSHDCFSQQPKPQAIRYRGVKHLSDMLSHNNQTSDILYYEVLDIPLPVLENLKTLKVVFHHSTKDEVVSHSIRLPKNSTVGDLINDLKSKVEMSHPDAELRLLEIFHHKIYKILLPFERILGINDHYWTLRAEEIPDEETKLGPQDQLIQFCHFMRDSNQNQQVRNFGEPFLLVIYEGESLANVKRRVQRKLQVQDEEFAKWKFAFMSLGRTEYLKDSDVISSRFQGRDGYSGWEQYLGLDHSNITPKGPLIANQS